MIICPPQIGSFLPQKKNERIVPQATGFKWQLEAPDLDHKKENY